MVAEKHFQEHALIVDTNVLLALPQIDRVKWGVAGIDVFILRGVLDDELRGLMRGKNHTGRLAKSAYEYLGNLERQMPAEGQPLPEGGRLRIVDAPPELATPLDPASVDHQQIALAQRWRSGGANRFCALVTRDREMADIARLVPPTIPVIQPQPHEMEKTRQQLARLVEWSLKFQSNGKEREATIKEAQPAERAAEKPDERLRQQIHTYAERIRLSNYRAVLALSPLEIRLALTAFLVEKLAAGEKRTLFLFVPEQEDVRWWATLLWKQLGLPREAICVFGEETPRTGRTRVLLYHHDQVERRLPHHVARFRKAGRSITALVDGAELLDPAALAMILFYCRQFIGYTQLPLDHAQAAGGRMLDNFFNQQTVATYTFADAEHDGWLHPFDVIRHPVRLLDYEEEEYERLKGELVAQHARVLQDYPRLRQSSDFWRSLLQLLAQHVDDQAAGLFTRRERLENIAQDSRAKVAVVERLLATGTRPAHCLVLDADYERFWSNTLQHSLGQQGYRVAVAERETPEETWQALWRDFAEGRTDCLVAPRVPPHNLAPTTIRRLILPTALAPLQVLAAMTDWTLSHVSGGPPVSVDLLYTVDTPEQAAMIAFAGASFGLRFHATTRLL